MYGTNPAYLSSQQPYVALNAAPFHTKSPQRNSKVTYSYVPQPANTTRSTPTSATSALAFLPSYTPYSANHAIIPQPPLKAADSPISLLPPQPTPKPVTQAALGAERCSPRSPRLD